MSVYKALIDFRDNDNDPMWVKNEDKWSILKIATVSKRDRGKSILELYFTEEEFLQIFIDDIKSNHHFDKFHESLLMPILKTSRLEFQKLLTFI